MLRLKRSDWRCGWGDWMGKGDWDKVEIEGMVLGF